MAALTGGARSKAGDKAIDICAKRFRDIMNFIGGDGDLLDDGVAGPGFLIQLGDQL
jgi:hypothetical protein